MTLHSCLSILNAWTSSMICIYGELLGILCELFIELLLVWTFVSFIFKLQKALPYTMLYAETDMHPLWNTDVQYSVFFVFLNLKS